MSENKDFICGQCKMKFESQQDLSNHQKKFCKDYDNVTKLESRLKRLTDPKAGPSSKPIIKKAQIVNQHQLDLRGKKQSLDMQRAKEREDLQSILAQIREKEDRKHHNNKEMDDINHTLKEIRKQKAVYMKDEKKTQLQNLEHKKKELEQEQAKLNQELKQMDDDVLHSVQREQERVQQKVDKSKYFNSERHRRSDPIKEGTEEQARLKYKREILTQDQQKLNKGIKINDLVSRGRSVETTKSSLANIGNDIMNSSKDAYGNNIKTSQDRINKLMEERKRTMRQIDNDSTFDQIDQLQIDVDNGYNTDINKYRDGIGKYTTQIRTEREMNAEEKARRLGNIRSKVSSFDPTMNDRNKVNYHAAKPVLEKQLNKLNGIIRSERNRETNEERRRVLENMNRKVPRYEKQNQSVLDSFRKPGHNPYGQPLINKYNQNASRMSHRSLGNRINLSHQMPNVNQSFQDNRIPDAKSYLPDVGHFKQNVDRPEDLEIEERAIMNMYAKDFDDLKLLNMLSKNDELYQHKLKQYKEVSNTRIQAEKHLQEQRLSK